MKKETTAEVKEEPKAKESALMESYKKQSPEKYEAKKARGEFKGL